MSATEPEAARQSDAGIELGELDELPWDKLAGAAPTPAVSASIREVCTEHLTPARRMSAARRVALSLASSLGAGLAIVLALGHNAVAPSALRTALLGAGAWALVMCGVLALGFARPPGRRSSTRLRAAIAFGLPTLFFLYLALTGQEHLPLLEYTAGHSGRALECGALSLAAGGLSSTGVLLAWRHTDPLTPTLSGALAGLVGGLSAALGVGLACPTTDSWHLVLSHGAMVVACVIAGALVGRKLLAP